MAASGTLIAALAQDNQRGLVRQAATAWARMFDMDVRIVHALDTSGLEGTGFATERGYLSAAVAERWVDAKLRTDESWLSAEQGSWTCPRALTHTILFGSPAQAVIAEAVAHHGNLVITGASPADYGKTVRGLSTALTLMHEAPLPVLIVHAGAVADVGRPGFRILIADDMRSGSEEAIHKAYQLASKLPGAVILHGHVVEQASGIGTIDLACRAGPFRKPARSAGIEIVFEVRHGEVLQQIRQVASEFRPDLIVFGRHRAMHLRPLLGGRMPALSMVDCGAAVLLVPPARDLYGPMAFPSRLQAARTQKPKPLPARFTGSGSSARPADEGADDHRQPLVRLARRAGIGGGLSINMRVLPDGLAESDLKLRTRPTTKA